MTVRVVHKPVPKGNYAIKSSVEKVERILDYKMLLDNIIEGKYNIFLQYDIS